MRRRLFLAVLVSVAPAGTACRAQPIVPPSRVSQGTPTRAPDVARDPHTPPIPEEAALVALLAQQGIVVQSIAGSTAEGLLGTRYPARFIRTDRGVVEVLFVGEVADALRVCERVEGSRFTYTLSGGQVIDANRRLHFAAHGGIFAMTDSEPLAHAVLQALSAAPAAC